MLAAKLLKRDAGRADAGRLDWLGLLLLSPGLGLFVFGLSESESHGGFTDPVVWGPIVAGVALVALFVRHSLRADRPLIDVRLFRKRTFSAAASTTFLVGAALFGAMIILPLYYQVARGESALTAGLLMAPQGLGAAMAMPLAGRLTDTLGGGRVAVVGLTILTLGTIPFAFLDGLDLLHAAGAAAGRARARDRRVDDAGDGRRLRDAAARRGARARRARSTRCSGSAARSAPPCWRSSSRARSRTSSRRRRSGQSAPAASGTLERLPEDLRSRLAEPLAAAFASTFWWAVGISVLALIPATILALSQRRERGDEAAAFAEPEQQIA